jgi:hypothetical protein
MANKYWPAKGAQPMRFGTLASMIDEWGEPLQKALDTLIKGNLVRSVAAGQPRTIQRFRWRKNLSFRPILNGSTASTNNIHPRFQVIHRPTPSYLAALSCWQPDPKLLEDLLCLPVSFITLVLRLADAYQFWWSERVFDLEGSFA